MKNKILIIIILIVIGITTVFILNNNQLKIKNSITINVGDEIPTIKDYTKKKINVKIKFKNIELEDNKVYKTGTYKASFKYKNQNYEVKLKVIDNIKPTIEGVQDIEINQNDEIDLFENITISDNSKDELKKEIIGDYDITEVGEYNLKYVVTDKSGNEVEEEFKLIVNDKTSKKVIKKTSKGYKIEQIDGLYYINGILIANKSYDLTPDYNPGGLLDIFNKNYNNMQKDAINAGINLNIISGFRSYATQQNLYNRYVSRDGVAAADTYSARPGHSEHQTGLAADINKISYTWHTTKEGKWVYDNCYKYGFVIRYTQDGESKTGYKFEPWHIRYLGVDIATKLYNGGNWITLEEYLGITSKYD